MEQKLSLEETLSGKGASTEKAAFDAHISEDQLRRQTALAHSLGVAQRAREFAAVFHCAEWGWGIGLLHDLGKWTAGFQRRLQGGPRVDHSTAGAQVLKNMTPPNYMAAYAVMGHHAGLPDGGSAADAAGEATLFGRLKKPVEDFSAYERELELPSFPMPPAVKLLERSGFTASFFIRMLFSCLVDADYLDTEFFMQNGQVERGGGEPVETLCERLLRHVEPWRKNENPATVNGRRTMMLNDCIAAGQTFGQGVYTLTMPTGGGKTIASLAFALEQARRYGLRRVIYVIPYTNIIEQNAQVFRDILGDENVPEHHSGVSYDDSEELQKIQLAAENWDRPVVVTTNVQFFESLFSNKPSRCRKLHNIAGSVIVFDEAQMFPAPYLKPCVRAIAELAANYRCTAVLCTATQPTLGQFLPSGMETREICRNVEGHFAFFKRAQTQMLGTVSEERLLQEITGREHGGQADVTERALSENVWRARKDCTGEQAGEAKRTPRQALCILNSRKRVQRVFETLRETESCVYHLSTLMYPAHRRRVLAEVRERLKNGRDCILVATSLVEAGVDVDFQTVFRELAGLDSVIQAAGRCNREGKRNRETCRVVVFTMEKEEDFAVPRELRQPIRVAQQVAESGGDFMGLGAVEEYFRRLYHYKGEGTDALQIVERFENGMRGCSYPFAEVSREFQVIDSAAETILIDVEEEARAIAERLRRGAFSRRLLREAGMYRVNVYQNDFEALQGAGLLEQIAPQIYGLRDRSLYTQEQGLLLKARRGDAVMM